MKQTVTLEIAGTRFRLVADTDEAHLQELAALVNERVAQLGKGGSASSGQLLALVALGLADDLKTAERKLKRVEELTRRTVHSALARIDHRLGEALDHVGQQPQADDEDDAP
ncbi:MAG: cell division protein ZapA [Myxococcales bacterium]|nr:cell division protein ZapA [Myxococcales bacterium]